MNKNQEKTFLKYCSRGDKYASDRMKELVKSYDDVVKNGSVKDMFLMVASMIHNGSEAESILLNIYDVLNNNHDDSTDSLKGQQWFIKMMIDVYIELLRDDNNRSLVAFYKRGESK